jgi:pyrimidine-nucleoside phosphorylase
MKTQADAEALAASLVSTWKAMGKKVAAVVTDMSQPLGWAVGNFFEVEEALDYLEGTWEPDLHELTARLGAWMFLAAGKVSSVAEGEKLFTELIHSGQAMERFMQNVRLQGGDPDKLLALRGKCKAKESTVIKADFSGILGPIDAYKIALASVRVGVGRATADAAVYPDVGIVLNRKAGAAVRAGDELCSIYAREPGALEEALALARGAFAPAESYTPKSIVLKEIQAL